VTWVYNESLVLHIGIIIEAVAHSTNSQKGDDLSNYHPIAVVPIVVKILLEKIVATQLSTILQAMIFCILTKEHISMVSLYRRYSTDAITTSLDTGNFVCATFIFSWTKESI